MQVLTDNCNVNNFQVTEKYHDYGTSLPVTSENLKKSETSDSSDTSNAELFLRRSSNWKEMRAKVNLN
jgi:hypothetical protein